MKRTLIAFCSLLLSPNIALATTEPQPQPIEVMVLGTYHFANPGRDAVNIKADDVTRPDRQNELEALAVALAKFKPDRVLIERQIDSESLAVDDFAEFRPEHLVTRHSENVQIGYRLARRLGHSAVYGFDEQPGEGEPDYFPLGKVQAFANDNGLEGDFSNLFAAAQQKATAFEAQQKCMSIPALLVLENDPAEVLYWHNKLYYGMLKYGDHDNQAGAELNAYWYMRNAKMFAKIGLVAKPGERVFVLVGAGHKYWLDHFANNVPGYKAVNPKPYLEDATKGLPQSETC